MTPQGLALLALAALVLVLWVLNLVRLGRLYVGYAVLIVVATGMVVVSVGLSPVRRILLAGIDWIFPGAGAVLILGLLVVVVLVYLLNQITILSNRIASIAQELAILAAHREGERDAAWRASGSVPAQPATPDD